MVDEIKILQLNVPKYEIFKTFLVKIKQKTFSCVITFLLLFDYIKYSL